MDFALRQPWADAQGYNLSPLRGWLFRCRNVNIHSIDKHAFVLNLRRKTNIHSRFAQLQNLLVNAGFRAFGASSLAAFPIYAFAPTFASADAIICVRISFSETRMSHSG